MLLSMNEQKIGGISDSYGVGGVGGGSENRSV